MRSRVVFVSALLFALVGCAGENVAAHPYQAEFEQALRDATSDFEREVLADHMITDAEIAEAESLRNVCLRANGVIAEKIQSHWHYTSIDSVAPADEEAMMQAMEAAHFSCSFGTTALTEPLYNQITSNPENRNYGQWVVECMVANGAREQGYSIALLDEDLRSGVETAQDDARLQRCLEDPDYVGPVEVDPNWAPGGPSQVITVNPDGSAAKIEAE